MLDCDAARLMCVFPFPQIAMDMESVRSRLNAAGQEHLLAHWGKLSQEQKRELYDDITR